MSLPDYIEGLGSVAHKVRGLILDLWGVVHDGVKPLPFTIDTLKTDEKGEAAHLDALQRPPPRAMSWSKKLNEMGVGPELYDGIMTRARPAIWPCATSTWPNGAGSASTSAP